ncbi:MAG: hypothetical protein KDC48_14170, partial [Planctomycetes bacterium]|nr:hypothetical protein [Planctomycetota bacterium]
LDYAWRVRRLVHWFGWLLLGVFSGAALGMLVVGVFNEHTRGAGNLDVFAVLGGVGAGLAAGVWGARWHWRCAQGRSRLVRAAAATGLLGLVVIGVALVIKRSPSHPRPAGHAVPVPDDLELVMLTTALVTIVVGAGLWLIGWSAGSAPRRGR